MALTDVEDDITSVVEKAGPSVVTIATVQLMRGASLRPQPVEGVGSGIIISADGLVVTNHHVVRGARTAHVVLHDGRKLEAEYIGGDQEYDIALLRVNAEGLPPAPLADSDRLKVGQIAIAIGSPFGHFLSGPTVTVGVVSAVNRDLRGAQGVLENLIQTDAPINPGNSGGALLNRKGEVIGVNTAIIPYAQGIGFSVPINHVKHVVEQVLAHGRVRRPWLGIAGVTVTDRVAKYYDLDRARGVFAFHVEDGSPADAAGMRDGDVVTALDGERVDSVEALRSRIRGKKPGDALRVEFEQSGASREARVRLAERVSEVRP